VSQVAVAEIGETKTLAPLEAGLASPKTTTMNYGSLSNVEGAWVVIVNRKSGFLVDKFLRQGLVLRRSKRETHLHCVKSVQSTRAAASINFSRYIIIY
jgi:hypothetical protein